MSTLSGRSFDAAPTSKRSSAVRGLANAPWLNVTGEVTLVPPRRWIIPPGEVMTIPNQDSIEVGVARIRIGHLEVGAVQPGQIARAITVRKSKRLRAGPCGGDEAGDIREVTYVERAPTSSVRLRFGTDD